MFPIVRAKVLNPLKEYLEHNTFDPAKNTDPVEKAFIMDDFQKNFIPNHELLSFGVASLGCNLRAYKLNIGVKRDPGVTPVKKALVYFPSNDDYVASCLPDIEPLIRKINNEHLEVSCFCQDYFRDKRFNPNCKSEFSSHFSIELDATDQASLIRHLIDDGYKPEDIILYGHSYGSAVALWTVYQLIEKESLDFANLKFFSERGYGTLFDFSFMKNLQEHARHHRSKDPKAPKVAPGKCEISSLDSQLATHYSLRMKSLSDVKPATFIQALLLETPIEILFPFHFKDFDASGYAMKADAIPGSKEFIDLPLSVYHGRHPIAKETNAIVLQSNVITDLLKRLHEYCLDHMHRGIDSNHGGNYKKGLPLFTTKWTKRWSLRQQLEKATELMSCLSKQPEPDWGEIQVLNASVGPHKSGKLELIFADIYQVAEDYQHIQNFNFSLRGMKNRRNLREEKASFLAKFDGNFFTNPAQLVEDYLNPEQTEDYPEPAPSPK